MLLLRAFVRKALVILVRFRLAPCPPEKESEQKDLKFNTQNKAYSLEIQIKFMDLSYVIPMGIFSMKLLLIKKEKLIKAVTNPRTFLTDLKLLVLASVLGVLYFIFTLS